MNSIRKLAGQTFIYGLSVILTRLINVVVTPIITNNVDTHLYGIFTNLYAYVGIFQVILAFGLETGYFRFVSESKNKKDVFPNVRNFILLGSVSFCLLISVSSKFIAGIMNLEQFSVLLIILSIILCLDSLSNIALAKLRHENRPKKFAIINVLSVIIYVSIVYLCLKPFQDSVIFGFAIKRYQLEIIIAANLLQAAFKFVLLSNIVFSDMRGFNGSLFKKIIRYSFPLLIIQLCGILNIQIDKVLMPILIIGEKKLENTGIYGANFKMILFITLFNQMFRYAADPFFFGEKNKSDSKQTYADVLKFFVIGGLSIILIVVGYLDIFKHFIGDDYWIGLHIVPFLLFAGLLQGIFYNLSFWYKLNDLNKYGIIITSIGSTAFIGLLIILVPIMGYAGAAYAMVIANFVLVLTCYLMGRKFYPINYEWIKIIVYFVVAIGFVFLFEKLSIERTYLKYSFNTLLILIFFVGILISEKKEIIKIWKNKT